MIKIKLYATDIMLSILLIIVLVIAYLPEEMPMPTSLRMTVLAIFAVIIILFVLLIWKEKPRDEREGYHSLYSGKIAYTIGVILLSIGNIYQVLNHNVDLWLPLTLAAMVITKFATRFFLESRN